MPLIAHESKGRSPKSRGPLRLMTLLAMLAATMFLAACGGSDNSDGGGGGGSTSGDLELFDQMKPAPDAETVDTSEFASDASEYKIGFSDVSLVNSWRVQSRKTAEIKADEWGVDLVVTDADGDAKKQIADIEDLLAQGVDALVVSPVEPDSIASVVDRAAAKGIPVIIWSGKVNTDSYTSEIVTDDTKFGIEGGQFLCDQLNEGDKVIMLRGIAGITVETDRYDGAKAELDGCGLDVVGEEYGDWAFAKGKTAAENLLAANSEIDGVWSSGADMTRGAVQAFDEANRPLVPMTGEALNGFLKLWEKDKLQSVAPIYPPWMGAEAVKLAVMALQGKEIVKNYQPGSPPISEDSLSEDVAPDLPDDYWLDDGYLTDTQLNEVFSKK